MTWGSNHNCIFFVAIIFIIACNNAPSTPEEGDQLLATVYNKSLYLSELDGMLPENTSSEDSVKIINAYVERWIRKSLLMQEAEKNIPKDLNIDKLVRDYRASLVQYTYEQSLVEKELDSIVTKRELNDFYEKNKEQYQLDAPIIRCNFIKVSQDAPELKQLQSFWQSDNMEDARPLLEYCNKHAEEFLLDDSIWYKVNIIAEELPKGTLTSTNIGTRKEISIRDNDYLYLFRLLELVNRKEIAPLSYIEDQASKVILHRRKIKLLEAKKEELYEQETNKNNVKVFPVSD